MIRAYVHNSELQRRWAWAFLAPHLKEVSSNASILDIGCGDGKITADISKFVPEGKVVGIDISEPMLDWSKRQYHPTEYPNLSFQKGSFLEIEEPHSFDWVVSFCALQHCSDQKSALLEISRVLGSDGKLLILVPAVHENIAWNQARSIVQSKEKWACYWTGYPPRKFFSAHEYVELLEAADFRVIKIDTVQTMDPFINREEILDWLEGTFPPVVPKNQVREFYNEWIGEYIRLDPESIGTDGTIYARLGFIGIEAELNNRKEE